MLVKTFVSAVYGIEASIITIEVNISGGAKPFYLIVGVPDNAVRESMQRIEACKPIISVCQAKDHRKLWPRPISARNREGWAG